MFIVFLLEVTRQRRAQTEVERGVKGKRRGGAGSGVDQWAPAKRCKHDGNVYANKQGNFTCRSPPDG